MQNCTTGETVQHERRLAELMSIELFAHIASNCPGALQGRWRLLFDRCSQDATLWRYPEVTLEEAEAAYREAVRLNKGNDKAFNNLGIVLYRQARSREAVNAFREALRINPGNSRAADNLTAIEAAGNKVMAR